MYNGGNGYGTGTSYRDVNAPRRINIAGVQLRPIYVYIAIAALVIIAFYFVFQFLNIGLVTHFSLIAGLLLLVANLRELFGQSYNNHQQTALLNTMVGGSLLFAWTSQLLGPLMWLPAVVLLAIAVPLALGRATVYRHYLTTARGAFETVRRKVAGSRNS